jgi:antitoxin (DNA-binding transcriptional repressor) of toxin-antitoxin stability system
MISVLQLRRELPKVIRSLAKGGESIRVTYRGKPIADMMPVKTGSKRPPTDDAFYNICEMAVDGPKLTNADIDLTLYADADGVR